MPAAETTGSRAEAARAPAARWVRLRDSRLALWGSFVAVHLIWSVAAMIGQDKIFGDVITHYLPWAQGAVAGDGVPGIDTAWVYPVGALVPVLLPIVFGSALYGVAWLTMVAVLDAAAVALLTRRRDPQRWNAAWWWIAFQLVLGPIALTRLDTVSVSLAIVGLMWLATRPRTAIALLTVATWIKVWPAALLAAILIALHHRVRTIVVAVVTSAGVVALPLALGAGRHLLSFVGMQSSRALQVESPAATFWLWAAVLHRRGFEVVYNAPLNTFEVTGSGSLLLARLMTPLLGVAMIAVAALGVRAALRRDETALPALLLALVVTFMFVDKVLSPQYITWLAAPMVYGLVRQPRVFRTPAVLTLVVGALTQSFYPWMYDGVIAAQALPILLLTARNVLLCVLLGWAIVRLSRAPSSVEALPSRR